MNIDPDKILNWLNGLYGVPKVALVFFCCLALGYALKKAPWFNNDRIPFSLAVFGAFMLPLLSDWTASPTKSVRIFILTNVVIGFITGVMSTVVYRTVIKRILVKIGASDQTDPPFPKPDGSNVKPPQFFSTGTPPLTPPEPPAKATP